MWKHPSRVKYESNRERWKIKTPGKGERWKHSKIVINERPEKGWKWKTLRGSPRKKAGFSFFFFSIWVFFHEHSRFTGQQGKGEGIYLTPLYHFHPLHRHLDISRAITAGSSPLRIAGSRTWTGNLWFPRTSR